MRIARRRRIASVLVLAFVVMAFAAVGAGGSAQKPSLAVFTTTPVLASGVAPVTGGTVTVTATPNLANVGDSGAPIQVATAPIDASGNFVLQPTTTSGALASLISSALAQNNGWVNLDLTETGADGTTTIQSITRQYVDSSGQPVSLSAFQSAETAGQTGTTAPTSGLGRWVGSQADNGSTTVGPAYAAIGQASGAVLKTPSSAASSLAPAAVPPPPCTPTVTVVNQTDKDTVVGEFHTPKDIVFGSDKTFFKYGKSADTTSDVGVSVGGSNWSLSGSVHIGNSHDVGSSYPQRSDLGYQVVTGFFYKEYHYVYPNYSYCPSNYYETKQYSWSGTPTPLGPGVNNHDVDGACLTRPSGQIADIPKGETWYRNSQAFIKFGAAFNVFGFSGGTQSGASSYVHIQYVAGTYNTNHYICGNGNSPFYSTRVFAGG
jgi:hypothetical protein